MAIEIAPCARMFVDVTGHPLREAKFVAMSTPMRVSVEKHLLLLSHPTPAWPMLGRNLTSRIGAARRLPMRRRDPETHPVTDMQWLRATTIGRRGRGSVGGGGQGRRTDSSKIVSKIIPSFIPSTGRTRRHERDTSDANPQLTALRDTASPARSLHTPRLADDAG